MKKKEEKNLPEVYSLRDAMSRLFDESVWDPFRNADYLGGAAFKTWFPRLDVKEDKNYVRVVADVPGIDPDNISVEVKDDHMIISGKQEKEDIQKDENIYREERYCGEFRREFNLPARVKSGEVKAKIKDGVLRVDLPKIEEEKVRRVAIEKE